MAAKNPATSGSRRSRDPGQGEMTIGRYTRLDEIGRGSFATVYQGIHNKHRAYVAIKSVNLSKLNKKLKDNLSSEIEILKGLHHPHIVALIDCHESASHIHLVMEYCALGDLSLFIKKRDTLGSHRFTRDMIAKYPNPLSGGLNEVIVRHFLKQLASALQFLRARDLIHRDVKPQNLLLNPSPLDYVKGAPQILSYKRSEDSFTPLAGVESLPMLKIADFGFARSLPSTSLAETLCGSPLYMAPEILRYEKYDAKADLWSVGTVLYEMVVGKPPFRASNHVDLLRRIERGEDKIKFAEENEASDSMKQLIRGLLKRNPVERMSFKDFFESSVVKGEIPGLAVEDQRPQGTIGSDADTLKSQRDSQSMRQEREGRVAGVPVNSSSPNGRSLLPQSDAQRPVTPRPLSGNFSKPVTSVRRVGSREKPDLQRAAVTARRQSAAANSTSPGQDPHDVSPAAAAMERQRSRNTSSPGSSLLKEEATDRERTMKKQPDDIAAAERERERAAQDVAFERDYVVVEKRAVEVNAFADELAASPRLYQQNHTSARQAGATARPPSTPTTPHSPAASPAAPSRALQTATGRSRADSAHRRQDSHERRYASGPTSATSAISKALNMASGRLFGVGFSPPLAITKGGRSPPLAYSPFPAYPLGQGSLVVFGDGAKTHVALDEDTKTVQIIEECATRSDVVYGFAEVKYKQLIPLAPSMQPDVAMKPGIMAHNVSRDPADSTDGGLTVDAVITLSEEALVLYVKALSLLAKSMDIAGAWWARKNRGEVIGDSSSSRSDHNSTTSTAVGNRVNNVVQWVRNRFNEVLQKAEFVRLKLIEGQKRLPIDHPYHASNQSADSGSGAGLGTSVDHVVVSSGITAEKLMYDRALEMSRSAAINELTGEDLPGCEIAYVTAIRMLEAILENDEVPQSRKGSNEGKESTPDHDNAVINGVPAEDRKVVVKLVASIRSRLAALRKKIALMAKRTSAPPIVSSGKAPASHLRPASPAVGGTPPR